MDEEYEVVDDFNVLDYYSENGSIDESEEDEVKFELQLASLLMSEGKIEDAERVIENIDIDKVK